MGINTETSKLRDTIINAINESKLPPVNIALVLENVFNEVNMLYLKSIEEEKKEEIDGNNN